MIRDGGARGEFSLTVVYPQFSSSGKPRSGHINTSLGLSYLPNCGLGGGNMTEMKNIFYSRFHVTCIIMK